MEAGPPFCLTVARDPALTDVALGVDDLAESVYLPEEAFECGTYFWQWTDGDTGSPVFSFEVREDATVVEVPAASEWLCRLPDGHPRFLIRPEGVPRLRATRADARAEKWSMLREHADALLAESHEMQEPPCESDRSSPSRRFAPWFKSVLDTRSFVAGAETLALAYLASGDERYAQAACQRMVCVSQWDPDGSTHMAYNDEPHMMIIWYGPAACDWVWDRFSLGERELVVRSFRRRGQITFEYMHRHGYYGVTRFDSHAAREIVFLAQTALAFYDQIPEAETWLAWLRPVLCGIWPIWAGDDGAWAEGILYSGAYVGIMTRFVTALKCGTAIDLFQRPFWRGHLRWRQYCLPPYAEWVGFGDGTERRRGLWTSNTHLIELVSRNLGAGEFTQYAKQFAAEAEKFPTARAASDVQSLSLPYLTLLDRPEPEETPGQERVLRIFPAAGQAAIRSDLNDPQNDVAFLFRSSPYGDISHSHPDNNAFIMHVAGKVMAMPSGYYDGYGSPHHNYWIRHTKSSNCVTLSDASQIQRSPDSAGAIERPYEDQRIAYFRGNADACYRHLASRCRRHVIFLKSQTCVVMIEEYVAHPEIPANLQWNLHSWASFEVDEAHQLFRLARGGSTLEGRFLWHPGGTSC